LHNQLALQNIQGMTQKMDLWQYKKCSCVWRV